MAVKGKWLFTILMILLLSPGIIQSDTLFSPEILASPFFLDTKEGGFGIESGISLFLGYADILYAIGLKASLDTAFHDSSGVHPDADGLWFHSKLLFCQSYWPDRYNLSEKKDTPWGAEWSCGITWFHENIDLDMFDYYGFSFSCCLGFPFPLKNISGEFENSIDLLFGFDPGFILLNMAPQYQGEFKLMFDPGIRSVLFFLETKLSYYTIALYEFNTSTFFISIGAGCRFAFSTGTQTENNTDDTTTIVTEDIAADKMTDTEQESDQASDHKNDSDAGEKSDTDAEKLAVSITGNKVYFYSIRFIAFSDDLEPASYPVLDQIALVLEKRKNIGISISAYAEYRENPVEEFNLYTSRAKMIKKYLVDKGIDEKRIKISSIGQIVMDSESGKSTPVIFEITGGNFPE